MLRSFVLAAAAALFLAPAPDDAYTIKVKDTAEGDVLQIQKSETTDSANKVVDSTGKALADEKHKTVSTSAYKETILKCEPKKSPTKLERAYEKASETTDGKETVLPYQGKTVLIEKKDGKYHFSIEGKELNDKDAGPLVKEFSSERENREELEKAFLPKKPVNVDDTWDIDMKPLLKVFNKDDAMVVDADKAKGTATLVKAYKKDDKQFGIIKLSMSLPVKSVGKGNEKIVAAANSIFSMDMELDGCIDGSSGAGIFKGGFKLDLKGSMQHPQAGKLDVSSSVQSKSEEAQKELPKK